MTCALFTGSSVLSDVFGQLPGTCTIRCSVCFICCSQDWKWPPTLDSYWKIKYFWLIFVGCNFIWIAVPLYIYLYTLQQMKKQLPKCKIN